MPTLNAPLSSMGSPMARAGHALRQVMRTRELIAEWKRAEDSWIYRHLRPPLPRAPRKLFIEDRGFRTNAAAGAQPIAAEYGEIDASRSPEDVRSSSVIGDTFAWLAMHRPGTIVEFGAAFGLSGMYWLSGIEAAGTGHLYSFEINPLWERFARANLTAIGRSFTLTLGSFEEHVDSVLQGKPIDVAFVDGIHTYDWVMPQFELIKSRAARGAILLFDDIDFPTGRMRECWEHIAAQDEVIAACELNRHVGVIELR